MITLLRKTRMQMRPSIHRFNPLGRANCSPIEQFFWFFIFSVYSMVYLGRYLDKDEPRLGNIFIK
jgi:hypothetical protein